MTALDLIPQKKINSHESTEKGTTLLNTVIPTNNKQKNENRKPLFSKHNNNCSREDPLMDTKISG